MKRCSKCGLVKEESEFYHHKTTKDGLTLQCKQCMTEYRHSHKEHYRSYMTLRRASDNETIKEVRRRSSGNHPEWRMYSQAKRRAAERGLDFNIELSDIIIPPVCPLLGVPFITGTKGNYEFTPSLDRIDPTKGYVKGNVWVITKKANSMKNSATKEELLTFVKNVIKYFGDNDIVQSSQETVSVTD